MNVVDQNHPDPVADVTFGVVSQTDLLALAATFLQPIELSSTHSPSLFLLI